MEKGVEVVWRRVQMWCGEGCRDGVEKGCRRGVEKGVDIMSLCRSQTQ